ncbi:dehydrogenase/reductase SDR family member on chromosome X isoform X2 [Folsomia candida]|uniref:dehydrogenase/reductase SDR family member on chromosome X isoform X2 n=1 Tax=Folsomia candida TaxID=158441 RepID=UPI001604C3F5|nr:dehydrogenase/reductase SDR family member on chromosome X isoform X2 [Folsomia candida]
MPSKPFGERASQLAISLDLSSINSIKEFAFKVMKKDVTITVLINNAGVKDIPYGLTVEGLEQHFQVNYLGHVLLTYMLLPKLHWSAQTDKHGRIVNVSSLEHYGAYPNLSDSQMIEFYSSEKAYMDTKLMLTAWSGFLDKRLQKIGASVRSYSVHPGFVKTEMWNRVGWVHKIGILHRLFFERTHSAAESIAYTSLSPQLEGSGGVFLANNELVEPHPLCKDEKFQNKLWDLSCKILNIEENELAPLHELDFGEMNSDDEEMDQVKHVHIDHKNQNEIDLEYIEEFHACDYKYFGDEFSPYKSDLKNASSLNSGVDDSQKSSSSSFLTSWKHSVKLKLNLKVFKYFSLSSLEETPRMRQTPGNKNTKPYYEYFINSLFSHWNLNKSCLRYLEVVSIFVLRRLDRFNSQFKLIQTFVRSD